MRQVNFRDKHLYILLALFTACTGIYYFGELVKLFGWDALRWDIFYTVHDPHRMLFLFPILYSSYIYGLRGALLANLISLLIFLPRAFFISPYPDPVLRMSVFVILSTILSTIMAVALSDRNKRSRLEDRLRQTIEQYRGISALFLWLLILLAVCILAAAYLFYSNYEKNYKAQVQNQLASVADLKAGELVQWRKERMGDANLLSSNLAFSALSQQYLEHPDDTNTQQQLKSWLTEFQKNYHYTSVFLLDAQGSGRLFVPDTTGLVPLAITQDAQLSLQSGNITILDLDRDADTSQPYMAILAPIFSNKDRNIPLGIVVMRIDPNQYLYPLIQKWPTPSITAETLIIRRDGDDTLYLNELRFQKDTALTLRIPLENTKVPAVQAALGHEGTMEGIDYRGVPVIADIRRIPDSPWFMVARMDTSEAYAPLVQVLWMIIALVVALLVGSGAAVGLVGRQQSNRLYKTRAETAELLLESERKYRTLITQSPDGIFVVNLQGIFLAVNKIMCEKLGYSEKEMLSMSIWNIVPEQFVEQHKKRMADIVTGKAPNEAAEYTVRGKDGTLYYVEILSAPYYEGKELIGFQGIARDITDRKKAEEALQREKIMLERTEGIAHVGSWEWDIATDTVTWSDELFRIFQMEPQERAPSFAEHPALYHPDDMARLRQAVEAAVADGTPYELELRAIRKDGETRVCMARGFAEIGPGGRPGRLFGSLQDITERKQVEEALSREKLFAESLVDTAQTIILVLDTSGHIVTFNSYMERICGYRLEEVVGKDWFSTFLPKDKQAKTSEIFQRALGDIQTKGNIDEIVTKDGRIRTVEWFDKTLKDTGDRIVGLLSTGQDITERKQTEDALEEREKFLDNVIEHTPNPLWISDDKGTVIRINQALKELLQVTEEEIVGKYNVFQDIQVKEQGFLPLVQSVFEQGKTVSFTIDYHTEKETYLGLQQSTHRIIDIIISAVKNKDGKVVNAICLEKNVTGQKQAEESILRSKLLLQNVIDSTPDWMYVKDREHKYIMVNKSFAESQNVSPQEMIGRPDTDFFAGELCLGNPEKGITGFHADDDLAFEGKIVRNPRNIVSWPDGSLHIYNTYKIPLHDQFGSIYGVLVYSRDMTEWQKAQDDREAAFNSLQKTLHDVINAMARVVEMRDPYTAGHQQRVAELAGAIAREIKMDDSRIEYIIMAATIHDIGKMYIPADILGKPGKLSGIEREMINTHPQGGYDILKEIEFNGPVALMVLQHHERIDGSGYPNGLKGNEMLPEAKILAVADVVEAIASHRPYRPALGIAESLEEISSKRGKLYDPVSVDACLTLFKEKGFHFKD